MMLKVIPNRQLAISIKALTESRFLFLSSVDQEKFTTIVAETYYEIIKSLCSAILIIYGLKAHGEYAHRELIRAMAGYGLNSNEIAIVDDLRVRRNNSLYEGREIEYSYLENLGKSTMHIIAKLRIILDNRLSVI
ncbi:MAG: hypothetical protein ABIG95_01020 [Candidatus Woesearchaeota archaeon]